MLPSEQVKKIVPTYSSSEINSPVHLRRGPIKITCDKRVFSTSGWARLELAARDRVIITTHFNNSPEALAIWYSKKPKTLRFGETGRATPVICSRATTTASGTELDFIPQKGSMVLCQDRRARLKEAKFHLINFGNEVQ